MFDFIRVAEVRGQGHSCPKVVRYNFNIKMHPHTKFDIDTSNSVGICWEYNFLSIGGRGQGHSDLKEYVTFQYPNMYPKYGISVI